MDARTFVEEKLSQTRAPKLPRPEVRRWIRAGAPPKADGRRWTQDEIAEYCGVTREEVSKWERGRRRPSGDRLLLYAELLDELKRLAETDPR